ncbi:hypothetical protein BDW66DRAFT_137718 [Aspergillus desertorum]
MCRRRAVEGPPLTASLPASCDNRGLNSVWVLPAPFIQLLPFVFRPCLFWQIFDFFRVQSLHLSGPLTCRCPSSAPLYDFRSSVVCCPSGHRCHPCSHGIAETAHLHIPIAS